MEKLILEDKKLENKIINAAYKNFKMEKRNPSVITEEAEVITEGLKFFKTSPRLYKLALKLERRAHQNPQMLETAKKVNALANKFEYTEDLFAVGKKQEAKTEYKELCDKYLDVIKLLKKEEFKDALKKSGALALTVASMCIPYMAMQRFFPTLSLASVQGSELTGLKRAGLYLKRAGAFTLCGIPIKAARGLMNYGSQELELKTLKSVDRMLNSREQEHSIYDDENGDPEMQLG